MFLISKRNFICHLSNVSFVYGLCPQGNVGEIRCCRIRQNSSRTCGITLNDKFLHFEVSDSLRFATSQSWDLSSPDHEIDIAEILAFVIADR